MGIGWILILSIAALGAILVLSSVYYSWLMQRLLYGRVEDLEYVRVHSLPPDRWQRRFLIKARKAGKIEPADQRRQTAKNLAKLEKLIRFAETTRFMESEEVRAEVLLVLRLVKREWRDTLED